MHVFCLNTFSFLHNYLLLYTVLGREVEPSFLGDALVLKRRRHNFVWGHKK